jgi:hypothetical protein
MKLGSELKHGKKNTWHTPDSWKFYFDLKAHFVNFLVPRLEIWERKLLENNKKGRKCLVIVISTKKHCLNWCQWVPFDEESSILVGFPYNMSGKRDWVLFWFFLGSVGFGSLGWF